MKHNSIPLVISSQGNNPACKRYNVVHFSLGYFSTLTAREENFPFLPRSFKGKKNTLLRHSFSAALCSSIASHIYQECTHNDEQNYIQSDK
jgi:hypothetical protein